MKNFRISRKTYNKCMKELQEYGYIRYKPSSNPQVGSKVQLKKKCECMENNGTVPMLFPYEPEEFWKQLRVIIQEELSKENKNKAGVGNLMETPGLTQKPLYKMEEVCEIFRVTRTTIHEWVKLGKLRKIKMRSRVYFLGTDIDQLLK